MYANFVTVVASGFTPPWKVVLSERVYIPQMFVQNRTGSVRKLILLSLMRRLYRRADVVTGNSLSSVRFLSKFIGGRPIYAQMPNPIDVDAVNNLAKMPPEIRPADFVGPHILALGRLDPQKGFDVLLEALALIRRLYPWHLLLVGDGPERERLRTLARALGVEKAIQWIGAVNNPFPYYRWADLVVLPSRFEGFPNVALEAMGCGRTVICADCKTGPRELTLSGRYGVLVDPEDAQSLASAIVRWSQDAGERTRMGALAQNHVRATYDISQVKKVFARTLCLNV
jgi:glycosyltransferase involved in cell wall biosynthesis